VFLQVNAPSADFAEALVPTQGRCHTVAASCPCGGTWTRAATTQDGTWVGTDVRVLGVRQVHRLAERVLGGDEAQRFLDLALRLR